MGTIQQRIRRIREEQNLSIEEFGQMMGTFTRTIIHIESERSRPQISFIAKLHQCFPQYSLEYLIYGKEKQEGNVDSDVNMTKPDPMIHQAAEQVVVHQLGSSSLIQHKFSIGYNHAGRIMDKLEHIGIVGPVQGNNERNVLCADLTDLNKRRTTSKSLDIEEVRQIIDGLKRGIARIESWIDDMDNEGFYLPNE